MAYQNCWLIVPYIWFTVLIQYLWLTVLIEIYLVDRLRNEIVEYLRLSYLLTHWLMRPLPLSQTLVQGFLWI